MLRMLNTFKKRHQLMLNESLKITPQRTLEPNIFIEK